MPNGDLVFPTGNPDIDGILWGNKWTDASLTYSFPTLASDYFGYTAVNNFEAFNSVQQAAVAKIMANYNAVISLPITLSTPNTIGLRFGEVDSVTFKTPTVDQTFNVGTALGITPDPSDYDIVAWGDTLYNHTDFNSPKPGSYGFFNLIHEPGHALGLKHGHVTQTNTGFNPDVTFPELPAAHNSSEYSVMTYDTYVGANSTGTLYAGNGSYAQTLMQDDIAALQFLYGADYNTNKTNTVYSWSPTTGQMFINGHGQGAPEANKILLTIWDGDGTDTYDMSNYHNAVSIDLQPGHFSKTGTIQLADLGEFGPDGKGKHMAHGEIFNSLLHNNSVRSIIENANGGSGNDVLTGNQVRNALYGNAGNDSLRGLDNNDKLVGGAGNDNLLGGRGEDFLYGNAGHDTFRFSNISDTTTASSTSDLIMDFKHSDGDRIQLSEIDSNVASGTNNVFTFIGTHAFTHAGQVRYTHSGGYTDVWLSTDADHAAEALIRVHGTLTLVAHDFIL